MQPARSMLLNDESRCAFDLFWSGLACRLAGLFEVAFAFVFGQRHSTENKPRIARMGTRVVEALAAAARLPKFRVGRKRRYKELRFARQRLADEVPDETTNDDVLTQFGNLGIQQVANCHIRVFDENLLN